MAPVLVPYLFLLFRTFRAMNTIVQNFFVEDWLSKQVKQSQSATIAQFSTESAEEPKNRDGIRISMQTISFYCLTSIVIMRQFNLKKVLTMPNFIEAISSKFGKLSKEQIYPQVIEPASGERQRILENVCREILQHSYFSGGDFNQFTASMIELLGGSIEATRRNDSKKESHSLADHNNNVSITFQHKIYSKYTVAWKYATITIESPTISERLEYGIPVSKKLGASRGPLLSSRVHLDQSPAFSSYISGNMEEFFPGSIATYQRHIDFATEGKQFCERVFGIYQRGREQIT